MSRPTRTGRTVQVVLIALCLLTVTATVAAAAWPAGVMHHAIPASRVAGPNRYANSVLAARTAYPGWTGVDHVVIACGADTTLFNPLMASSLCWAYGAPLFLVAGTSVPNEVAQALAEIRSVNPTFTVTVVDGTAVVGPAALAKIKSSAGASSTVEQPWPTAGRYGLGRAIASRVRARAAATSRTIPPVAFVVNGLTSTRILEGASAAAISARTGIPVLITRPEEVYPATIAAVAESGATERIVIGSTAAVSSAAAAQVQATARWSASSVSQNAASIASRVLSRGWARGESVVFYRTLADAVASAQIAGNLDGISLFVSGGRLEKPTANLLSKITSAPAGAWVFGSTAVIPSSIQREIGGSPGLPAVTSLKRWEGAKARVAGTTGSNTTKVSLYVNGRATVSRYVTPFSSYDLGLISVPSGRSTWKVIASNPDGKTSYVLKTVDRLRFPYATCIIVDKSEFKLYWVKNNVLVKTYPVAIGRPSMETPVRLWRVGAKLVCDPRGVYGPRKLALWRWTGSGWAYTNYGIHGTNEPWVIGTKASHGCIRLYNKDILELWPQVPLYTPVITRQ